MENLKQAFGETYNYRYAPKIVWDNPLIYCFVALVCN